MNKYNANLSFFLQNAANHVEQHFHRISTKVNFDQATPILFDMKFFEISGKSSPILF